jgi:succinoglycan biosynthesis transport protein ExoP
MSSISSLPSTPIPIRSGNPVAKLRQKPDLELRDLILLLRKRKTIILGALTLGLALTSIYVLLAHRKYSSTATIEINKSSENSLGLPDLSGIASDLGDQDQLNMDLLTEQAVIMSDSTALRVIDTLKLDAKLPDATPAGGLTVRSATEPALPVERVPDRREKLLAAFKSGLKVDLIKGTRLLEVTYTDTNPDRATAIANSVVDVYIDDYTQARYQASSKVSSWLTGQLADLKDKVEQSQAKVDAFQRDSGLTGMRVSSSGDEGRSGLAELSGSSDNVPLERLIQLNRDLTNAEVSRIAKEAIYKMTETQDPDVVLGIGTSVLASGLRPDSPLAAGSEDLTLLHQLRQQRAQVQVELAANSARLGPRNPLMIQLGNEATTLDAQIHTELERIRARARNDLDLAILAENGIRQQVAAQEQTVNKVTEKSDQLVLLQQEALSSRAIYQDLYTKLEEASVAAGIKASNITLVDPARSPAHPSSPKPFKTIAAGAVAGLLLGLMAAFGWDYFDDSIVVPEQVEQVTQVPVIGAIPDFAQKRSAAGRYGFRPKPQELPGEEAHPWLKRAPRSHASEAYRALRTALLMSRAEAPPRAILIMSASPEEGKSTTCLNTAAAFAMQGDRVLYLDADLRRAQAHRYFHCTNEIGLSNCLTGGVDYRTVLKGSSDFPSLSLLPAGPHPPNPSELLGSRRFAELLAELKRNFDYVFIDSSPILLVTDAQLISSLADGYVLVVRSKTTSKRLLQRCLSLLRASKVPPLGIVVNALDAESAAYSSYEDYSKAGAYYVDEKS